MARVREVLHGRRRRHPRGRISAAPTSRGTPLTAAPAVVARRRAASGPGPAPASASAPELHDEDQRLRDTVRMTEERAAVTAPIAPTAMNAQGTATSGPRTHVRLDQRHVREARHQHQQPHRRHDRRALKLAARMVGTHPENVGAHHDADGEERPGATQRRRSSRPRAAAAQDDRPSTCRGRTPARRPTRTPARSPRAACPSRETPAARRSMDSDPVTAMLATTAGATVGAGLAASARTARASPSPWRRPRPRRRV